MKHKKYFKSKPFAWFHLYGFMESSKMSALQDNLAGLHHRGTKELVLQICSPGGDPALGIAFYQWVKFANIKLTTIAIGEVCSAALPVFLSGSRRCVANGTTFYFHEGSPGVRKDWCVAELEGSAQMFRTHTATIRKFLVRDTKLKSAEIKKMENKSRCVSAKEALNCELAQEILYV